MKRHWTSDLHLGHRNIIEYCPNRQKLPGVAEVPLGAPLTYNVDAMNEALIDRWNDAVAPEDEVFINGDLVMGKISETLPLVGLLNGKKKLGIGNHDRPFGTFGSDVPKKQREWARWSKAYEDVGLELVDGWFDMEIGGYTVRVCHFPYEGDSQDKDRYVEERPPNNGLVLICGHVHDAWRVKDRMINVGVDVWDYRPVPESELIRLIKEMQ